MADVLTPPDATQFQAFSTGDEPALAKIYRANYDALVSQAKSLLGPELEHFSGRVAQQAMLGAWTQRGQLDSSATLVAALDAGVRNEADLQRRKHAALHHGNHAPSRSAAHPSVPTADAAVEKLLAELHAAPVDHVQAAAESVAARKHSAAAHVGKVGGGRGWVKPVALIGGFAIVIVVLMRWLGSSSADVAATKALQAENARSLSAARGQRGNVTLNDGSVAKIGSDSHIKLPADFGGLVRTLELSGSAAFTVAAGGKLPFEVRAGNAVIVATGTKLTVRAYDTDPAVIVAVDEGSVTVHAKDQSATTPVAAGKAVRVTKDGQVQPIDDTQRAVALSWVNDSLVFVDTPVSVALPELIRFFDLKATLADSALGARPVSMRIGLKSSGEALKAMAAAAKLSIGFGKNDVVMLSDAPAANVAAPKAKATKKR